MELMEVNKHSMKLLLMAFLRESLFTYQYRNNNLIFHLQCSGYVLCVSNVKLFSLLRFRNYDSLLLISKENRSAKLITNPMELLEIVKNELKSTSNLYEWDSVQTEIANHLQNAELSRAEKAKLSKLLLPKENEKVHVSKLFHNLAICKNVKCSSLLFEQIAFNGHPFHPCAKTKLGFSIEDVLRYSPDFSPTVFIMLLAVQKNHLHVEQSRDQPNLTSWFAKQYPHAYVDWLKELNRQSLNEQDYLPFPVHPWQAENIIPDLFVDFIKEKVIVLIDNVTIRMSPTLSFRTVAPIENLQAPYMKLAVGILTTSTLRTISNGSTENAPKITDLLMEILTKENNISARLSILPEYYGLHLKDIPEEKSKHFTTIFRENINNYLQENETAIVVATLFEKVPSNDRILFLELMHLAGCSNYQSALKYFYDYTDVVLGGYLDLYLIYGIALEGHQQNTLAIFQNASIKRVVARDFGAITVHGPTLEAQGFKYKAYPGSPTLTKNKSEARDTLLHTVYQMHLGELVLILAEFFSCDEAPFWDIVKSITCQRFERLKRGIGATSVWNAEYEAILKEDWPLKAMFRMRLVNERYGLFCSIRNPFNEINTIFQ